MHTPKEIKEALFNLRDEEMPMPFVAKGEDDTKARKMDFIPTDVPVIDALMAKVSKVVPVNYYDLHNGPMYNSENEQFFLLYPELFPKREDYAYSVLHELMHAIDFNHNFMNHPLNDNLNDYAKGEIRADLAALLIYEMLGRTPPMGLQYARRWMEDVGYEDLGWMGALLGVKGDELPHRRKMIEDEVDKAFKLAHYALALVDKEDLWK